MIVFVDSDVLLDAALGRQQHADHAFALLDRLERRLAAGYVAWHSVSNLYHLARGPKGKSETKDFIREMLRFIQVAPVSTAALQRALRLRIADFEDAMQVACAEACKAEVIATRNLEDYRRSPVPAVAPAKLVDEINGYNQTRPPASL